MKKMQIGESPDSFDSGKPGYTGILEHPELDFWFYNDQTGKEIINQANKHTQVLEGDVQPVLNMDLAALLDYISENNHQVARKNAVTIYDLAQTVAYRHSDVYPELNKIVAVMFLFMHDLLNHITREEQILFPNIRQLLKKNHHAEKGTYTTFGLIREWVDIMRKEHQVSCKNLKLLNDLTHNYSMPPGACVSYKYLLRIMKEFETDFLSFVQFENNIVFPRALVEDGESAATQF